MLSGMTFPWYLELFFLRTLMIYGLRNIFDLEGDFWFRRVAHSWLTRGTPTFVDLLGSV